MKTLREYIAYAEEQKKGIGHFNIATIDMFWAVVNGAKQASLEAGEQIPVIIGVSEGERDFVGIEQMRVLVDSIRSEGYPIFLNADHTYSVDRCKEAIDAGYDMVIFDAAKESYEVNRDGTKAVVDYRNEIGAATLIEAEFGYIGGGSNIKDELPEGVSEATMTDPAEAKKFVEETGVDILAPSVGNVHGMVKSGNPALNPERVHQIRSEAGVPLVLHGGSGSSDDDFRAVIQAGVGAIHISTEMRVAYHDALIDTLQNSDAIAPYKFLKPAREAVTDVVRERIKLFWEV
ncbi:MAG: fructose-bisphosphate aldolase class II [Planctomycetota bacterium]|jgi:fructose-bisphosphate aldolase class II